MNPTNMDIDSKGRIWVTEGMNYRRSHLRDKGDRIVVLSDTNNDGTADQSKVFYQGKDLASPLGIAVIGNEIYVANPPNILKFTDVDNDGVFTPNKDKKEVFLTGFHGKNHDHTLHSMTAGPDGNYYFNTGNIGHWNVKGTDGSFAERGKKSSDGHVYVQGAAFRVTPEGAKLQVIGHNFRNSFEQVVTSSGDIFQNDNDDTQSCRTSWLMLYGNAGYASADGKRRWLADKRPGQTTPHAHWRQADPGVMPAGDIYGTGAPAGIAFYENGALPEKYRGMLISCEAARNSLYGYFPKQHKANFALDRFNFATTNPNNHLSGTDHRTRKSTSLNTWFRPSDITVGPDGALYVCDFFDSRCGGHQTFDKRGTGAIYRIAPKQFKSVVPNINLGSVDGALQALKNPAVNVRHLGHRTLVKFGKTAVEPTAKLLSHENSWIRLRAIWVLSRLGSTGQAHVVSQLKSDDEQFRLTAFRALMAAKYQKKKGLVMRMTKDPSPAIRREVALHLRNASFENSKDAILQLTKGYDGVDRTYLEALGTASSGKEDKIYAFLKKELNQGDLNHWSAQFEGMAWRLHPNNSIKNHGSRALSKLNLNARLRAIEAIAFNPSKEAAQAMLYIATHCKDDVFAMTHYWIKHRLTNSWKDHGIQKGFSLIKRIPKPIKNNEVATFKLDDLKLSAKAKKGKDLFLGRAACFACHKMGDKGKNIGPSLSLIGAKYNSEVIREAMINPCSAIVFGYELTDIKTKDGVAHSGFVISDADPLILKTVGGTRVNIKRSTIATIKTSNKSIMPSAKALGLSEIDIDALTTFLNEVAEKAQK